MTLPLDPVKREIYLNRLRARLIKRNKELSGDKNPMKDPINVQKMVAAQKGQKRPSISGDKNPMRRPDVAAKLSASIGGGKSPNIGKHPSDATRLKQSIARLGKKRSIATREKMSGPNCHLWKGGVSFGKYCPKFSREFKERVRAFFGYTCQLCGHVWQPGEMQLAVHHVNYNKNACCDPEIPRLFVPVCSGKCHSLTNHHREDYEKRFTELIMTKYNGQCYLPKLNAQRVEQNIKGGL